MTSGTTLPLRVQCGYATAEAGINTAETILRLYLLAFYTDQVGLSAALAGLAIALAICWDAVTDPVMGVISDRTRHRFGGRRGYLPLGGLWLGLGVVAVFLPPALDSQATKFAWLLLSYCFLNTGMTVLSVPYAAMAGEMTENPHQRTVLFGARFAAANFGAVLAAVLPMVGTLPEVGVVTALLVLATALGTWWATAEVRFLLPPLTDTPLWQAFALPFGNVTFRPLIAAYVVANAGIGVQAASFVYYYQHVLRVSDADRQLVLAVLLGVFTASIAFWVWLSRRCGKRVPLIVGASVLGVGTTLLYTLVPAGGVAWVMGCGAIGLGAFVGSIVLIDTLLTDVLDHDFLRTGQLRSGLFFGVWKFASKLVRAGSFVIVTGVLALAGFVESGGVQPPAVHTALVLLFGPGVGAFFIAAAWILHRYRFTDRKQAQVRQLLARRQARLAPGANG
jgi:Na+/melibiose symporter-like transporter